MSRIWISFITDKHIFDSSEEEKQNFLRENILDQGYDVNMFVEFLIGKKGEDGADVGNWSMRELQLVVNEFISM